MRRAVPHSDSARFLFVDVTIVQAGRGGGGTHHTHTARLEAVSKHSAARVKVSDGDSRVPKGRRMYAAGGPSRTPRASCLCASWSCLLISSLLGHRLWLLRDLITRVLRLAANPRPHTIDVMIARGGCRASELCSHQS